MSTYTLEAGIPSPEYAYQKILIAVRIANKYRDTPTAKQLVADFGMSRATAYRWRAAFKIAKGES